MRIYSTFLLSLFYAFFTFIVPSANFINHQDGFYEDVMTTYDDNFMFDFFQGMYTYMAWLTLALILIKCRRPVDTDRMSMV